MRARDQLIKQTVEVCQPDGKRIFLDKRQLLPAQKRTSWPIRQARAVHVLDLEVHLQVAR